jgi:hypothetical protein
MPMRRCPARELIANRPAPPAAHWQATEPSAGTAGAGGLGRDQSELIFLKMLVRMSAILPGL